MKLTHREFTDKNYSRKEIVISNDSGTSTATIHSIPYANGNCQITALAYVGNLYSKYLSLKEVCEKLFAVNESLLPTRCILIDVKEIYIKYVEKDFPQEAILMKSPYKSSNNSSMCIFIIKVKD